jgi:uncharacterized protein (DUF486 family)
MSFVSALIQPGQWPYVAPIILLFCSNLFMTLAWYGHLKFKAVSLVIVVLVSWGIAFVEYCFAVPANRIGSAVYSPAELKTIQEVITLIVFAGFTAIYFDEPLSWTQAAGFSAPRSCSMARLERVGPFQAPDGRCRPEDRAGTTRRERRFPPPG